MPSRIDLHEYQNRAVDFIKNKKRSFLMLEMGLGKTVSTLTAISDLLKTKLVKKVLVIAPLRVANSVWVQESRKWEHTKHLSVARVLGDQNTRLKVLHYDYDVYVINRENVQWLVNHYGKKWAFDMVVIDECFPEGTMILTPLGVRDIKHLKTGDLVMTSVGEMPITKTFRKQTNELVKLHLSDGSTIECTRDHPFATEKGWVQAWRCGGLHFVRNDFHETKADSSVMQQDLFKETNALDENPRKKSSYFIKIWNYCEKEICNWGNRNLEQRKRVVRRSKEKIKRCTQEKRASPDSKGWKWKNSALRTINVRNVIRRMANAMCDTYQNAKKIRVSNVLQSGFWHLFKKNSYRGGWKLSHIAKASGRKKRYLSSTVRVDYIENIKCESERTVYNLETDGINDYFAEGILVHNCSSFKNPASQRFKAMKKILPFVEYMVLLTGTPSPNGLLDLWSQCYLVDYGNSLGRTMTAYKQRFFEQDYMGYSFTPRKGAQASIQKLMQPYSLSMQTADYLELPERINLIEEIELDTKSLALYKAFERDLFIEFEGHQVEAINAAVLANKLLQYCNGAMYVDEYKNWGEIHTAKLDTLAELIEQNDENILVAYNYRSDLERLQARFPTAVRLDKHDETIQAWNRGEIKLLLAHPQSAGHGINLYDGGCMTVWFSLCWSLEHYQQFNARLHRQGQTKPVRIVHLVVKDGIDGRVMQVINEKDATQNRLLSALR
jgi:hypothetical protein